MTDIIYIGKSRCKKAYSVTIRERKVNDKGKVTTTSINSTSFQIKDISGETTLIEIKKIIMGRLQK